MPLIQAQQKDTSDIHKISGVEVHGDRMSRTVVADPNLVRKLPSVSNSVEALIKTLPGVNSNNELSSQYSVRGGNYDENLVYVNDVEIFRPFLIRSGEQEGLSFINPDLVSTVRFSAGGFDAKYGDKMSSVLDIRYKRPTAFAGSVALDLLGVSAHLEGATRNQKVKGLIGVRQKSNQYLLGTLDTKGDYKPSFTDVQTYLSYTPNSHWELDFLGNLAINKYQFVPTSRRTNFSMGLDTRGVYVQFQGQETDRFNSVFGTISAAYNPTVNVQHRISLTGYQSVEREFFDIYGIYSLSEINMDGNSDEYGNPTETLGHGAYLNHARNELDAIIYNANYSGRYLTSKMYWLWGLKFQREDILDYLNEWKMVDSVGYNLPHPPLDSIGGINPSRPPLLQNAYKSDRHLVSNRYQAFVQNNLELSTELALVVGLRMSYWDFNREFLISPRASLTYAPKRLTDWSFRFASGLYYQPPFYRELRDLSGELNTNIKSQRSIHVVAGTDYYLNIWGQPFKFTADAYYKALSNLIPYEIDNVRVRYLARNMGEGYTMGLDLRLAGEVIEGAESWVSLSFMSAKERINGMSYVPRPTDQRVNFNVFFQDNLPGNDRLKAHLNLVFGTGLPYGSPDALKHTEMFQQRNNFRLPAYRRVDLGLSYHVKAFNLGKLWLSAEIFNMFDMNNTISYLWISDFNNNQYAVANYLTSRRINVKLSVEF
ncbi:MAG: TonB-dependent receptor plug domain-containing protein [Bacteroidales bacterium]|jgi:outer membrane receptor for ferrienterochelin and colicin|nr:TonB-dependent receptor plug domain-containing protein [Bacteroidales bacterium]